ncbi:MAG: uracil-DNA glycosylase [Deltaproteobacteria bacterium]|nr:MAG: uracil-DNA glycosylase [Deltaproteobacteria bacterium]
MQRIDCRICVNFFVTWKANRPYGCKAYGFESSQMPSIIVMQTSGEPCRMYRPKQKPKQNQNNEPSDGLVG